MKIGIADTTFARVNMAEFAIDAIKKNSKHEIERYTVPGFKDLPVACLRLFEDYNCDIVMAFGMAGAAPIDQQCAHEASTSLQNVELKVKKHIIEVFVHMNEVNNDEELYEIAKNRSEKHALNTLELLKGKTALTQFAGKGRRQGKEDEGPVKL
ncbi:MAG: riboflavin synthase [Candidatus Woesearchaeota archaeon]